jgi:ribosomal protein S4
MKKKRKSKRQKVDLDVRPMMLFKNYDYTAEGPNETSPGGGLYHGRMDRWKSVKDFIEQRRKKNKKISALVGLVDCFCKLAEVSK